ncbi:reverse transcriptase domain-containing protein [Tanacetum coccineum]
MKKLIAELPTLTAPMKGEELMVYLSAANEAVSVVLLVERRGRQMPIHYVSRSLQGAEVNYALMEMLAIALVHAARRLRRYFQGHTVKVITEKPINQILNSREALGSKKHILFSELSFLLSAAAYFKELLFLLLAKFGIPATIITDNETQLINDPLKSWAEGLGIKLISTSGPDEENEEALMMNFNLLEERREIAEIREARRKQQVEKYYNQRVHHKQFKVGEFFLRKNELSKVESTGKLGLKWEGPYEVIETYGTGAYKLWFMDGAEIPRTWHSSNLRKYYM